MANEKIKASEMVAKLQALIEEYGDQDLAIVPDREMVWLDIGGVEPVIGPDWVAFNIVISTPTHW